MSRKGRIFLLFLFCSSFLFGQEAPVVFKNDSLVYYTEEQQALIEAQQAKIEALEGRLVKIEAKLK